MKDKSYSDFITQPLEGNEIDLTTKLMSCNNTSLTNNLARLDVKNTQPESVNSLNKINSVCLTETSTSSISSTASSTSSAISQINSKPVDCGDIQVDFTKSESESNKLNTESNRTTGTKLNENELKAVDEFLKRQSWSNSDVKSWNTAIKFLMARRFDVERAIKLYEDHESLRKKESLYSINLCDEAFIKELEFGKFTILPFVKNFPVCALFTVKLHTVPNNTLHANDSTTLKVLIYQLDAALENPEAQRNGINFIYDMNNCKSSHFDMGLSQKILTLVRGSYPARLNKLFVVSAPFWFKCFVKVLSILMREKLRERVAFVSNEELKNQIPIEILPDYLGGAFKLDHKNWLNECNKLVKNDISTCSYYYYEDENSANKTEDTDNSITKDLNYSMTSYDNELLNGSNRKRPLIDQNDVESKKQIIEKDNFPEPLPFKDYYESIQTFESPYWLSISELINHVASVGAYGLSEEFKNIRAQPIYSSYDSFKAKGNEIKNRYRDVICLDHSRVKLKVDTINELEDKHRSDNFDYIHANFVDGYKQKNAFINAQGPLDETIVDFWLMIWQECTLVIAMTTKVIEQRRLKCAQYWPIEVGQVMKLENIFEIENTDTVELNDFKVTKLTIRHITSGESRNIVHCQFLSWPDHGVPKTASQILEFIQLVRAAQSEYLLELNSKNTGRQWDGHPLGPPICIHCSAGIGRTGTFCAIDISINRFNDQSVVNIKDTINKIRLQRAQSVQTRDQYVFCYMALVEYAQRNNSLSESLVDLEKLFNDLY